jgi:hypothetical protein
MLTNKINKGRIIMENQFERITTMALKRQKRIKSIKLFTKPGSVLITSGNCDTFMRSLEYSKWLEGQEILTNNYFGKDGFPDRVHHVRSMKEVMKITSKIMNQSNNKIFISLCGFQNSVDSYKKIAISNLKDLLKISGRMNQTWHIHFSNYNLIPNFLKDWNTIFAHFYQDRAYVYDFNKDAGTTFKSNDIVFAERTGYPIEVFKVGICPWLDKNNSHYWDHLIPAMKFELDLSFMLIFPAIKKRPSEEISSILKDIFLKEKEGSE